MLKIILTCFVVLISVYWVGEKARRNPKIDAFLSSIEGHYSTINEWLEDSTTMAGLKFLRRLYGWLSIILCILLFATSHFSPPNWSSTLSLFSVFAFMFMGWFSIKWVTEHKNTIAELSRDDVLIIFSPVFLGVFDVLFKTPFVNIFVLPLQHMADSLHITIPQISNPVALGSIISLILFAFFAFYYLLTWAITVPVFLISVFSVILPIQIARLLAAIDRENTFFWFTVFVMVVISIWLTQL
ncbi:MULTISPECIES: hypothetical protein [Methylomonas]|uniref:Uncharacterized protein n=2 Tax=Methylomonas TaxID=416 RepID=A0A126T4C4_9GAMM|nr:MULTISPECIES: hypothetical protein [Methylomonas]AMK76912.1 hypothetical protein JT25_010505 [Methylomonas denitrificans]OAH97553.1 hypothetical protein A1342_19150 [Methylomonas methanica]TCV73872.1 hypothetical protein EDE11_1427 [Methylomonas methanica]